MNPLATRCRRGNALMTGLMLTTLLGFSALAVDIGMIRVARTQLQASLDSAAVSGASQLDGTVAGITAASARAISTAAANRVFGQPVVVAPASVQIGTLVGEVFTPFPGGAAAAVTVNAVRIQDTSQSLVAALGGAAFGINSYTVQSRAMATRAWEGGRARESQCFLPFAIPDCHLAGLPAGQNPAPFKFTFNPSPSDNIAWGDPNANPNTNNIRNQLNGQCANGSIGIGDPMFVNEGVHNSALQTVASILNSGTGQPWSVPMYGSVPLRNGVQANLPGASAVSGASYGRTLQGVVALVDAGPDCSAVNFTGQKTITGFAWAVVYDVQDKGGNKNVWMQLDVLNPHKIWSTPDPTSTGPNIIAVEPPKMVNY